MAVERTNPRVMKAGEQALSIDSCRTQDGKPCSSLGRHSQEGTIASEMTPVSPANGLFFFFLQDGMGAGRGDVFNQFPSPPVAIGGTSPQGCKSRRDGPDPLLQIMKLGRVP